MKNLRTLSYTLDFSEALSQFHSNLHAEIGLFRFDFEIGKSYAGESTASHLSNKTIVIKKKGRQGFSYKWLQVPGFKDWLQELGTADFAWCNECLKKIRAGKHVLEKHAKSKRHVLRMNLISPGPLNLDFKIPSNEENEDKLECAAKELAIVSMAVKNNIPYKKINSIVECFQSFTNDPSLLRVKLSETRSQMIARNVIGHQTKRGLAEVLKNCLFTISMDESTDLSKHHLLSIEVRWANFETQKIESAFWDLYPIFEENKEASSSALTLFECLKTSFNKSDVPLKNIYAVSFDGCSTMNGNSKSVKVYLQNTIQDIITVRCPAHLTHLSLKHGMEELPANIMNLITNINSMLRSAHKLHNFENTQKNFNCEGKIVSYIDVRWLSLEAAVNAILKNFQPILDYANDLQMKDDNIGKKVHSEMNKPTIKSYLLLIKKVTWELNCLNRLLQSDQVIIHILWQKIEKCFKNIVSIVMRRDKIKKSFIDIDLFEENNYLPYEDFLIENEEEVHTHGDQLSEFYVHAFNFVIGVALYYQTNFKKLNTLLLKSINCLNPKNYLSDEETKTEDEQRNLEHFENLKKCLKVLIRDENLSETLSEQWITLKKQKSLDKNKNIVEFWMEVGSIENNKFIKLSEFALRALAIPHANAGPERRFSEMNFRKSKLKGNKLNETMNSEIHTAQMKKILQNNTFSKDMMIKKIATGRFYNNKYKEE
ncbi:hypothetical protein TKK_0009454 [Trichogramma kaykai]